MADAATGFFIFVFGLAIGSFLNVCIHRFPRGESVVRPRSHCPACMKPIGWRDNIPLVSFLLLRGKCRQCGAKISPRYLVMELAVGCLALVLWFHYGLSWFFVSSAVFLSLLLALAVTDIETGYLPDKLTVPGMALGTILAMLCPPLLNGTVWYDGLGKASLGLLGGGGILLGAGLLGNMIFRRESMGGGDIKLLAMIGTFIGIKKAIFVFFLAPVVAVPVALYIRFVRRDETLPFGPYLALTGAWFFFFGDWFLAEYFSF